MVVDNYSRYILSLTLFNHCPTTKDLTSVLNELKIKPEKMLFNNGGQFQKQWKDWCKWQEIEAIFAHPYYPQDKGKVERTIRNLSEKLVYLFINFSRWFNAKCIEDRRHWFNDKRYHRGVKDYPANLYQC